MLLSRRHLRVATSTSRHLSLVHVIRVLSRARRKGRVLHMHRSLLAKALVRVRVLHLVGAWRASVALLHVRHMRLGVWRHWRVASILRHWAAHEASRVLVCHGHATHHLRVELLLRAATRVALRHLGHCIY